MLRTTADTNTSTSVNSAHKFIEDNSFATFITHSSSGLFSSHINLIIDKRRQDNLVLLGHLSAANPQAKHLRENPAVTAVFNTHHSDKKAVHVAGTLTIIEDETELMYMLDNLIGKYETGRTCPWVAQWQKKQITSQMKGIVGFAVDISQIKEIPLQKAGQEQNNSLIGMQLGGSTPKIAALYNPKQFVENNSDIQEQFIKNNPACIFIICKAHEPLNIYHVNLAFSIRDDGKTCLVGHLPQTSHDASDTVSVMAIFTGPHTYISPSFYKTPYSVPTWNYTTVHAHGTARITHRDGMSAIEFLVSNIECKFKLNQNRTLEDRTGVVEGLSQSQAKPDQDIANLMRPGLKN